ncbi:MAG: FAD-binding oxidoreductase [Beggiatoa sp. IS2]|nr:MAG: FAD-binding oxidoreductase [Beggiatoa sp. IS2]
MTCPSDALIAELHQQLQGEVRFDDASRALYAFDASNYRQIPLGVVIPRTVADLGQTVAIAQHYELPVLIRGAGTSLAGQACNAALVIDTSKYLNRIHKIDAQRQLAWVEPGIVLDELQAAVKPYHLMFGPDPATHSRCTVGGMIGNNSCGAHSLLTGKTVDNVESLEILTVDGLRLWVGQTSENELTTHIQAGGRVGEIYQRLKALRDQYADLIRQKFPKIPRRVSGYNLDELLPENGFNVARSLVGSEGTCALILQAVVRLTPIPAHRVLLVLGFADIYQAGDRTPLILQHRPLCLEGLDADMITDMRKKNLELRNIALLPHGGAWLLVEFGGDTLEIAVDQAQQLLNVLPKNSVDYQLFTTTQQQRQIWSIREDGAAATNSVPGEPETYPGWEDAAVDPQRIGDYLRDFRKLLNRYDYRASLYGHFGEGCIHARITFDLRTPAGIQQWRAFLLEAADLVVHYGGSFSGEHGDGHARAELLPRLFGTELMSAFQEFKEIWDPTHKMNPGKIVFPYRLDEHLRTGPNYQPSPVATHFTFAADHGQFANAVARCIGVGKCRRTHGGLMCPSYQITHEEQFSPRGRAHLLFEMLQGELLCDRWNNEQIKFALDHCLACKGCKSDCPVSVDIATYKAEFFAHYYAYKRRPLVAHIIGRIHQGLRLATLMPTTVNFVTQTPILRDFIKWAGGIAPQRQLPLLAKQSFSQWFKQHRRNNVTRPDVILWNDTFNNYFHPQTSIAALQVLEIAGYRVTIPKKSLCCGRPLYDSGQLDLARQLLREILDSLRDEIQAGIPIVGLEPSCISVFRDELANFFPNDALAKQLRAQSFLFSEFLQRNTWKPPKLTGKAIVHGHCHQKALVGMDEEVALLTQLGLECTLPETGCCGMAGAFGFAAEKYILSVNLAERALLPAIRQASADTLIIANGFSCREQIAQLTGRQALHLAEVLQQRLISG